MFPSKITYKHGSVSLIPNGLDVINEFV
jgi:hypothetical protein